MNNESLEIQLIYLFWLFSMRCPNKTISFSWATRLYKTRKFAIILNICRFETVHLSILVIVSIYIVYLIVGHLSDA